MSLNIKVFLLKNNNVKLLFFYRKKTLAKICFKFIKTVKIYNKWLLIFF